MENIIYPKEAQAVIDVTAPPYRADNTGMTDCTEALVRAYDDCMRPTLEGLEERRRAELARTAGNENPRVIFPGGTAKSRILYFPNGTYLVRDSIVYSFTNLQNTSGSELNRQIHFQGQSREGVVIRLADNSPGFEKGNAKPVISFMRCSYLEDHEVPPYEEQEPVYLHTLPGLHSNVAMSNTIENMTIDTGSGNPGAVGLLYHCSNNGAIRDLTIRSGDPDNAGDIGLAITMGKPMGAYTKNVTIQGFDYGIKVNDFMLYTVFEHITLENQNRAGFCIVDIPVAIRDLQSRNRMPALQITGKRGHAVITESCLLEGDEKSPAIDIRKGFLYARSIRTEGYGAAIGTWSTAAQAMHPVVSGPDIREYASHGMHTLFGDSQENHGDKSIQAQMRTADWPIGSLRLPVEETPAIPWHRDFSQWTSVNHFGAMGDGETDDTAAIQAALGSGKEVVYFQPGRYLIDGTITVPETVLRINFMFVDLVAGPTLRKQNNEGAFKITGDPGTPLIMEDLFAWVDFLGLQYLIDHASTRTLILSDLHTQNGAMYINSVPGGNVYMENASCTTDNEEVKDNCFTFRGQKVWARQLNPERANPNVLNDGSDLWVLGFKTEMQGTSFTTINGGRTEVLGGVINNFGTGRDKGLNIDGTRGRAAIIVEDSRCTVLAVTNGRSEDGVYFSTIVRETRKNETRELAWDRLPQRYGKQVVVAYY